MLNWNNCFTNERIGQSDSSKTDRSDFERDYDRIIFSSAFRRLQNKTQVFPLPEHIFVHNRLTHSLEVASVGRSLGAIVGKHIADLNEVKNDEEAVDFYNNQLKSVIASACLAHDMGNPAFGHSGEEAISKYFIDREKDEKFRSLFSENEWEDLIRFEGNANALRVLTRQFKGRMPGGYQLTYTTLGSILKYPCPAHLSQKKKGLMHLKKYGYFQSDTDTFSAICDRLNMLEDPDNEGCYMRHPFVYLVEAADDICYTIMDYEDAHRLGILSTKEVSNAFLKIIQLNPKEDLQRLEERLRFLKNDSNETIAYLRAKSISTLVGKAADAFIQNTEKIRCGKFNTALLDWDTKTKEVVSTIKNDSFERIYNYKSVVKIELAGFKIMSGLIEDFTEAVLAEKKLNRHKKILRLIPSQYNVVDADSNYEKIMRVLDFISGMTDVYALELYKNLRGIEIPSI